MGFAARGGKVPGNDLLNSDSPVGQQHFIHFSPPKSTFRLTYFFPEIDMLIMIGADQMCICMSEINGENMRL